MPFLGLQDRARDRLVSIVLAIILVAANLIVGDNPDDVRRLITQEGGENVTVIIGEIFAEGPLSIAQILPALPLASVLGLFYGYILLITIPGFTALVFAVLFYLLSRLTRKLGSSHRWNWIVYHIPSLILMLLLLAPVAWAKITIPPLVKCLPTDFTLANAITSPPGCVDQILSEEIQQRDYDFDKILQYCLTLPDFKQVDGASFIVVTESGDLIAHVASFQEYCAYQIALRLNRDELQAPNSELSLTRSFQQAFLSNVNEAAGLGDYNELLKARFCEVYGAKTNSRAKQDRCSSFFNSQLGQVGLGGKSPTQQQADAIKQLLAPAPRLTAILSPSPEVLEGSLVNFEELKFNVEGDAKVEKSSNTLTIDASEYATLTTTLNRPLTELSIEMEVLSSSEAAAAGSVSTHKIDGQFTAMIDGYNSLVLTTLASGAGIIRTYKFEPVAHAQSASPNSHELTFAIRPMYLGSDKKPLFEKPFKIRISNFRISP